MEEISRIAQTGSEFDYSLIDHNVKSEVLDFFQTIGNLTKNKILDLDFVWRDYSYWLIHYWEFFKGAIERDREYGDYFWEDAEWLYNQFKQKYRNKKFIVNFKGFIEFENNCA